MFPAIKTALVDVCHRKKVRGITILKGYGELGLGEPHEPACLVRIRTPQNSALLSPNHTPSAGRAPAGHSSTLGSSKIGRRAPPRHHLLRVGGGGGGALLPILLLPRVLIPSLQLRNIRMISGLSYDLSMGLHEEVVTTPVEQLCVCVFLRTRQH